MACKTTSCIRGSVQAAIAKPSFLTSVLRKWWACIAGAEVINTAFKEHFAQYRLHFVLEPVSDPHEDHVVVDQG
eukprot:2117050-Amphidinium_carterae.1